MNKSSPINIDYVSDLARIKLTDQEKMTYQSQLSAVLDYFEKLDRVTVEGVEPIAHAFPIINVWQDDDPEETFTPEEAIKNAPKKRSQQIVVPKVVDDA